MNDATHRVSLNRVNKAIMNTIRYLVAATLLLPWSAVTSVPTSAAPASKAPAKTKVITKNDINAMLLASDKAANAKNIEAIIAQMAPDFVVKMTVSGQPTMTMN